MFVGHIGAGLALKKINPQINVAWPVFFALFADFLLGIFMLLGWEKFSVPENFAQKHYLIFHFPYSHGLLASLVWGLLISYMAFFITRNYGFAFILALAFLSHFLLDLLVHLPSIPLTGENSAKLGAGLWENMPLALFIEFGVLTLGWGLYLFSSKAHFFRKFSAGMLLALLTVTQYFGQTYANQPPKLYQLLTNWMGVSLFLFGIFYWIDQKKKQ